jgi:hypothetical protein
MKRHFTTLTLLATLVTLGCQKNIQKADEPNDSVAMGSEYYQAPFRLTLSRN